MNIKNNLLVSFRHLRADKTNTNINIAGLTLGLAIVTVVLVFVLNELGYNQFIPDRNRIYRVLNYNVADNNTWANTPFVAGETIADQYPEVEQYVHQYNIDNVEIKKNNEFIAEPDMLCTESNFFSMFGIPVLYGSLSDFDQTQKEVLLSKSLAKKYFGEQNPVGKIITLRSQGKEFPMEVAAVYADIPENSTIKASLITNVDFGIQHLENNLISVGQKPDEQQLHESWAGGLFFTNYLLLKKGASLKELEKKLKTLSAAHSTGKNKLSISLQPLTDIYFGSGKMMDNNRGDQGNLPMLYVLIFVGVLILVIAYINYLNLAFAQAFTQTKSWAVRKVCGASGKNLLSQMVLESVLLSVLALPFAMELAHISLPWISQFLGKSYPLPFSHQFFIITGILLLITVATGAFAGVLVSLRLSTFKLVETLKGKNVSGSPKVGWRKGMVIFQITVFIVLFAVMLLVQKQVRYAFHKDLGFKKAGLIRVDIGDHNYQLFKQEIKDNPNILDVSGALWLPPTTNAMYVSIPRVDNPSEQVKVRGLMADYHFAQTMCLHVLLGSDFDKNKNNSGVLINQSAIKALGLKDIIGEKTAFGTVVGVVNDFNMYSLHEAITPMIVALNPAMCREVAIRISTDNIPGTINFLKQEWKASGGTSTFNFQFSDDALQDIYESDIRFSKIIGLMAVIAILIASLGLFGLSLLLSRQRIKEIGIRKVNGAKVSEVMTLLNKDFIKWVIIAFVIATPIAWFAMNKWLENFAYKTTLSWWIFALAGILALGIALFTVSWQSWKAATRNPVEALRYE